MYPSEAQRNHPEDRNQWNAAKIVTVEAWIEEGRIAAEQLLFLKKRLEDTDEWLYLLPDAIGWYTSLRTPGGLVEVRQPDGTSVTSSERGPLHDDEVAVMTSLVAAAESSEEAQPLTGTKTATLGTAFEEARPRDPYIGTDGLLRTPIAESFEEKAWFDTQRHSTSKPQESKPEGDKPRLTWGRRDLTAVLAGEYERVMPTIGYRGNPEDEVGLMYPGKTHSIIGESESMKTWFALLICLMEMRAGKNVLYIDFEDDEGTVVPRLLWLGASVETIRQHFTYVCPEGAFSPADQVTLNQLVQEVKPSLAILDGVTEGMNLFGLDPDKNIDAAKFNGALIKPLAKSGAAVATLDHVTKSKESRGRYAIGAVHKLNGLTGVMYILENRRAFAPGMTGKSTVLIAKDRKGNVRKNSVRRSDGLHWFADFVLESISEDEIKSALFAPLEEVDGVSPADEKEDGELGELVLKLLGSSTRQLTTDEIRASLRRNKQRVVEALMQLEAEEKVSLELKGRTKLYSLPGAWGEALEEDEEPPAEQE